MSTKLCPICLSGELIETTFSSMLSHKGIEVNCNSFLHSVCSACESEITNEKQLKHNKLVAIEFQRTADGYLPPSEINRIRKKLKLNIRDASDLIGGGGIAFSKYENGITKQSSAVDNLIRLLDEHPELLDELKSFSAQRKVAEHVHATLFFQAANESSPAVSSHSVQNWCSATAQFLTTLFRPAEQSSEQEQNTPISPWMAF